MRRPPLNGLAALIVLTVLAPGTAVARSGAHVAKDAPSRFTSCASLVGYARQHFATTKGVPDVPVQATTEPASIQNVALPSSTPGATGSPPGAAPTAAATGDSTAGSTTSTSFSTTNVQETGVDEPDIVKTDGSTIFAVQGSTLFAVTAGDGAPHLAGSLSLGRLSGSQLLLRGTRLIVISSAIPSGPIPQTQGPVAAIAPAYYRSTTTVTEVDVSDPAGMHVTRTMTVDGRFVDARENGATARLVIASGPPALTAPGEAASAAGWVPKRHFRSMLTTHRYVRPVAGCRAIAHPRSFSGLGMLTILTIDLDHGLYEADADALMADAQVVYGSQDSLYVATQRWVAPQTPAGDLPSGGETVIQRFDVSDPDRTTLGSTGSVPGYLLNQFSLSEQNGYLRVATTTQPTWWDGTQQAQSQSRVTVLADRNASLTPVGSVTGLGAGQRITSVRFIGDAAYVVTFRQIDPLYVVDVSDPTAPRVAGQLELEGYSSYLQPVGDGRLLGIGTGVENNEPTGTQLELFDVSDAANPRLVSKVSLGQGSSSQAAVDHHALLWWPATGLAVLPVEIYGTYPPQFLGAIGYHVAANAITEVGRVSHDATDGYLPAVQRSVVIGNHLYTLSSAGVMASDLGTLARQAFAAFPPGTGSGGGGVIEPLTTPSPPVG